MWNEWIDLSTITMRTTTKPFRNHATCTLGCVFLWMRQSASAIVVAHECLHTFGGAFANGRLQSRSKFRSNEKHRCALCLCLCTHVRWMHYVCELTHSYTHTENHTHSTRSHRPIRTHLLIGGCGETIYQHSHRENVTILLIWQSVKTMRLRWRICWTGLFMYRYYTCR